MRWYEFQRDQRTYACLPEPTNKWASVSVGLTSENVLIRAYKSDHTIRYPDACRTTLSKEKRLGPYFRDQFNGVWTSTRLTTDAVRVLNSI